MTLENPQDACVLRRRRFNGGTDIVICGPDRVQHYLLKGYVTDAEWQYNKGREKKGRSMQFLKDLAGRSTANSDVFITGAAVAFFLTWIF